MCVWYQPPMHIHSRFCCINSNTKYIYIHIYFYLNLTICDLEFQFSKCCDNYFKFYPKKLFDRFCLIDVHKYLNFDVVICVVMSIKHSKSTERTGTEIILLSFHVLSHRHITSNVKTYPLQLKWNFKCMR